MTLREEYESDLIRHNENIALGIDHWTRVFRDNRDAARVFLDNERRLRDDLTIQLFYFDVEEGGEQP